MMVLEKHFMRFQNVHKKEAIVHDKSCEICHSMNKIEAIDFGSHPIASRYLNQPDESEKIFPRRLGTCTKCGIARLIDPISETDILPIHSWLTFSEPEQHLDDLAEKISCMKNINYNSTILSLTYKDHTLLKRLNNKGFCNTVQATMGNHDTFIRNFYNKESLENLSVILRNRNIGKADIIIARHILEHLPDINSFMRFIENNLSLNGYFIAEVPSSDKHLKNKDYSMPWEEHQYFFTPKTLENLLRISGFSVCWIDRNPYLLEDSLLVVCEKRTSDSPYEFIIADEVELVREYAASFKRKSLEIVNYLEKVSDSIGDIAFLGAGHLGGTFINLHQLEENFEFVVDDNPNKAGLYMPGSRLPIFPSSALLENGINTCLMGVNPALDQKIMINNQIYINNGGRFFSIFPGSAHYFLTCDELFNGNKE